MVLFIVCIERYALWDFTAPMENSQLISSGDRLTCFLSKTVASGKHALKRTFLKFLNDCFYTAIFLFLCIWQYKIFEQKLNHKCAMINSEDVNISDNNYNSILFLNISQSVQLNRSWGHHLGFMPVSITQWHIEIRIFYTRFCRASKSRSVLLLCNYCAIAFILFCMLHGLDFIHLWWRGAKSRTQKH